MRKRILIVDDDQINRGILYEILEDEYELATAETGEAGLDKMIEFGPDLVLLDIMMPGIDGWETLSRLKEDPDAKTIPVIIFTAREHSRGRQLAREMGAVDYFQKPFEPDELISIVREHVAAAENVQS